MELSVIIPVYNSEKSINAVVDSLKDNLGTIKYEVILINDGSTDQSENVCNNITKEHTNIYFINLRKNFGEHNAVMCGLNYSTGNYSVIIDDDFQTPPSEILTLFNKIKEGYDVVYSQYEKKEHNIFRNLGSQFNGWVAKHLLNKPKGLYLSSFKIIEKSLVDELIKYKGPFPYIDGLILRSTNSIGKVTVSHNKRTKGKSNYTFSKLVKLYLNMFFNFSILPMRFFTFSGVGAFFLGLILSVFVIIEKYYYPERNIGWASIMIAILIFSGFQLIFLGLIGEYLGKLFMDHNKTPQFVIKNTSGGISRNKSN